MVVADIGAGTGYLSRRMAPAVMPGGKVLAVDVQPEMVGHAAGMARQTGLAQIEPPLGAERRRAGCPPLRWTWRSWSTSITSWRFRTR